MRFFSSPWEFRLPGRTRIEKRSFYRRFGFLINSIFLIILLIAIIYFLMKMYYSRFGKNEQSRANRLLKSIRPSSAGPLKCGTVRLSGPVPPHQLKRETVVGRTDIQTHCCNYASKLHWSHLDKIVAAAIRRRRPPPLPSRDLDFKTWSCPSVEVVNQDRHLDGQRNGQTDRHHLSFNI
jgi:hypothetical protein